MKFCIVFSAFIFTCIFCPAQRAFTDEELVREFPKREKKFKLSGLPFVMPDTSVLSVNAVYVLEMVEDRYENHVVTGQDTGYIYMRFFNNGRVFFSFAYLSCPATYQFNDLTYGKFGRYIVNGDEIKAELFMNRQYGIMYMYAKPVKNGIQFFKLSGRGIGEKLMVTKTTEGGFYRKKYVSLNAY